MTLGETLHRHRGALLRIFLGSIAVNAVLGIWALLADDFGQTQGKILATSFLVSAAMLVVLANVTAIRRRYLWPVPAAAAVAGAASIAWFTALMWVEVDAEAPLKIGGSGLVVCAAGSLAGLMALVAPPPRLTAVRAVHNVLIAVLGTLILVVIWAETSGDLMARLIGVVAVLVAAVALAIPALARTEAGRSITGLAPSEAAVRFCPSCGQRLEPVSPHGRPVQCDHCGDWFVVSVP